MYEAACISEKLWVGQLNFSLSEIIRKKIKWNQN